MTVLGHSVIPSGDGRFEVTQTPLQTNPVFLDAMVSRRVSCPQDGAQRAQNGRTPLVVGATDDLVYAGVGQPDDLADGAPGHAGGSRRADSGISFGLRFGVALSRALQSFLGLHKPSVENLTNQRNPCSFLHMDTAQRHALNTANDILLGIYKTWNEDHSLEDCTKIAARVLGVEERTIDNAVLYSLTGGQGFLSDVEVMPAHLRPGYVR